MNDAVPAPIAGVDPGVCGYGRAHLVVPAIVRGEPSDTALVAIVRAPIVISVAIERAD